MPKLTRKMPLTDQSFDYPELKIQPVDGGMVMVQSSLNGLVKSMPKFGDLTAKDGELILSIMPDIWLILCDFPKVKTHLKKHQKSTAKQTIVTTDMSDQYLQMNLSGKHARALLAKGCELDLSPEKFTKNRAARTLLAHQNVVIWRTENEDLSLLIDASFAEHLWLWLEGATLEYSQD